MHKFDDADARLKEGVAPHTRYVRSRRERIDKAENTLLSLQQKITELRGRSEVVVRNLR